MVTLGQMEVEECSCQKSENEGHRNIVGLGEEAGTRLKLIYIIAYRGVGCHVT